MKEQLKRELNKTYLIFSSEGEDYQESYEIEMILKNHPKTLLDLHVLRIDGSVELYYDVSSKQSLKDCGGREKISGDTVWKLFEAVDRLLKEMKDLLLDTESVLLDLEHIYMSEGQFYFCYCPWKPQELLTSFRKMLEEILGELDYHDTEGVELAYHLYQNACKGIFQLSDILREHARDEERNALPEENYEADYFMENEPEEEFLTESESFKKKSKEKEGMLKRLVDFLFKKKEPEEAKWCVQEEVYSHEEISHAFLEDQPVEKYGTRMLQQTGSQTMLLSDVSMGHWKLCPLQQGYEEFCITEESFLVGKSRQSVDGYIGRDTVSRIHSRLVVREGRLFVADANSTNGTFVNGVPVEPGTEVEIFPGDRILFADVGYECYNSL